MRPGRALLPALLVALPLLASACAPPVGAIRADPKAVGRELTGNVLTTDDLSRSTRNVLFLNSLDVQYEDEPEKALERLRQIIVTGRGGPDEICAAAELSFYHAEISGQRSYYLASAVYAWIFLFPDGGSSPDPFDPRLRMATDLYNRSIALGFASADGLVVEPRSGTYELPWGTLQVDFDQAQMQWAGRTLVEFVPVSELKVQGLQYRFRRPGIGAALAAGIAPQTDDQEVRDIVAPKIKVQVTALLRMEDARRQLEGGQLHGTLALYPESDVATVDIAGKKVPLELEPSAALAWGLQEAPTWQREFRGFLGDVFQVGTTPQLVSMTPHRFGRIPIVFVHGTASSAGRWAEMLNVLQTDPIIRERYEFWFFSYDTGNAIVYSSMILRDSLTAAVKMMDPGGKDPGLKQMVVIGHSQGGLLTKMTAIHSGDTLYRGSLKRPLDELKISAETRELIQRGMFVEPLPFVKTVVFICTPHRGSYLAAREFVGNILRRLVSTPARVAKGTAEMMANRDAFVWNFSGSRLPTAVDNMSPNNPFVKAIQTIPVAPTVDAYSIIAVKGTGPYEDGDDGVVKYRSAHIDGVKSELVVRWEHSVQGRPEAIEEVRRILLLSSPK